MTGALLGRFRPLISTSGPVCHVSLYAPPNEYHSRHQAVSDIWSILADGTLNATLPDLVRKAENTKFIFIPSKWYSTTAVYVDISGTMISFIKDNGSPRMSNPISGLPAMRARIVFEPL
ncbi:hypothetical protein M407DRAFT_136229 [Tulasnella calospora MUT 4182]|uniref:Uncharacterized protein n=1 Tax=Tulasnella calospora MUT 4182 TaxID=1051891 RepID=A0A0C3MCB0_9AGAM|nr:hypothetical protein M407DRAFT_136229 [Tulasnella calospora MUT 4182]